MALLTMTVVFDDSANPEFQGANAWRGAIERWFRRGTTNGIAFTWYLVSPVNGPNLITDDASYFRKKYIR